MTRYRVVFTEPAEVDRDNAYLRRSHLKGPEDANRWYAQLAATVLSLEQMPRRGTVVERFEGDVRRIIFGRGSSAYLIVYRVFEPAEGETEGLVQVLRIRQGAMPQPQNQESQDD